MSHLPLALMIVLALAAQDAVSPSAEDRRAYEAARGRAGNHAAAHVALALWCEAHGMPAERGAELEQALALDPQNAAARGLQGRVHLRGRWCSPDDAVAALKADTKLNATLEEYRARRAKLARLAELEQREIAAVVQRGPKSKAAALKWQLDHRLAPEHAQLGLWCEQHGLKDEARAHFTTALDLDPYHEATWRKLGYVKHGRHWLTTAQLHAVNEEATAAHHAAAHWEPRLRKWARDLASEARHAEAELSQVADPLAVASVVHVFGRDAAAQPLAARLLTQIPGPGSTSALATLAVYGATDELCARASAALKDREPLDYAGSLVELIHTPCRFEYKPVGGPGSRGTLEVDTPRFHLKRDYLAYSLRIQDVVSSGGYAGYDVNGLPVLMRGHWYGHFLHEVREGDWSDARRYLDDAERFTAQFMTTIALQNELQRRRLAADVLALQSFNTRAEALNPRVASVLETALGAPNRLGDDEDAWRMWYFERIGYRYTPPPKVDLFGNQQPRLLPPRLANCFAAGTPVSTADGPRPIESLQIGDRVLGQDVATGTLAFRTVEVVRRNDADNAVRIALDNGDAVVASPFHRFWRAGRGWAMARELKPGDVVRRLGGTARVRTVDLDEFQPNYSLSVEGGTYFVGKSVVLVHDETLPDPHPEKPPFDRVVEVPDAG